MVVVYSPRYAIDIGPHVFPTTKYRMVHDRLLEAGLVRPADIIEPGEASWDELALVHTREYLATLRDGTMSAEAIAELELPWSRQMVDGFRVMVAGTILAAKRGRVEFSTGTDFALTNSVVREKTPATIPTQLSPISEVTKIPPDPICHIGGGLHHAFANHGEGFCPFNDVAVAVRVLQSRGVERVAIVDLDVHHGNGTAFLFESDPRVFTFSMHQQHNYPMWKPRSSLDIGLADGTRDETFLNALDRALPQVMASRPEAVFYLAGADPYEDDQLGGLRLTRDGLRRRDRLVIETVRAAGVPLVITLAGGYARRIEDTVAIHVATIEEALATTRTPMTAPDPNT
jgi:acetoin utilization deacetylase AcuC-like enzyme